MAQSTHTEPTSGASRDADFSALVAAVTSAFGDPTRRRVYLFVRETPGGVTASQVAEHFSLHPNVARHHLDKLVAGGYVEATSARAIAGGAGRPSKRYRASGPAPLLEPAQRSADLDDLLLDLLEGALALLPASTAEEMAERVGFAYGTKLAARLGRAESLTTSRTALQAVADALTAHGFEAHAEGRGRLVALIKDACPIFDAASRHPVICAVDRGMVKGMLSSLYAGDATRADLSGVQWSSRAHGDESCMTCLPAGA
ncbi:MAG TPA: helix-turn-helix domain-containing protein [Acidimicrobiales bacterium]|nr:helix-turn-helix domain-containing protein [Acidimicrobiales bacterium]